MNLCIICSTSSPSLTQEICPDCVATYSNNKSAARVKIEEAIRDPKTTVAKLDGIARLARCSVVCTIE